MTNVKSRAMIICFVSGHLDLSQDEFEKQYVPLISKAIANGHDFVVGDARGADTMAQEYLRDMAVAGHLEPMQVRVFHAYNQPRHNLGFESVGGFASQSAKDASMTKASDYDVAWVRKGREDSGTARNIERRKKAQS